jgi:tetratricopeptide (TPR) repeat protein
MLALLGQIYAAAHQTPRARECYSRALDLNRRLGQTGAQLPLLAALAELALETRQVGQAATLYEQALRLATSTGDRAAAARLHGRLGRLAHRQRNQTAALDHMRRARDMAEAAGQPALLNQALQHLATLQHAIGDAEAVDTYREAVTLCGRLGDTPGEALMLLNLGTLLSAGGNGHRDEGLDMLERVTALAPDLGDRGTELAERARAALDAAGDAPRARPQPEESNGYHHAVGDLDFPSRFVAYRDKEEETDAVFDEATLPPH